MHPVIGWEQEIPVPEEHQFNHYLSAKNGRLHWDGFDLARLIDPATTPYPDLQQTLPSPLELVYLPQISTQIHKMQAVFADLIAELNYPAQFIYTYASKANAAEEVIRTTLKAGAHHEMSSMIDVAIAQMMIERGLLSPDKMIIGNGFKETGSDYAQKLTALRQHHSKLIPVIEDLGELTTFIEDSATYKVGLRHKTYGHHENAEEMNSANSRFGLDDERLWKAADYIQAAPNLTLAMYHGMVGSQLTDMDEFLLRLTPPLEMFARLRQRFSTLQIFNFGGGMPVAMTLDFDFDYHAFVRKLLTTAMEICNRYNVPAPDIMGEFGRYTTSEHGAHLFKIITVKENNSKLPWYIIDGSIMSSFPDSWALSEHFIVLPLNHLDKPFQQVQLGGITCDSDDVYPPKPSKSPLYLPALSPDDELYIGFFSIGAYQEMLGGVKGSKHCVLPEAQELIIDRKENGTITFELLAGQTFEDVLQNLGFIK